uniref:Prostaglandin E2 receptor EP4 subtype-like n=1 Tax=Salarias fasciatus TaxID=181472 RepID=A0A672J5M3_SALFA
LLCGCRNVVRSLVTSATMFAVGVLGNLIAIVVLCISKKEQKETTFYTLVCGMAITDLLGTCFTSPVVIATYVANRWPGGALLCHFFSFSMLFFGSAGMSILCAMAVERYLAINQAYFYSQYIDRTMARFALLLAYLVNVVLCIMPSFGFGQHVRHFPGTWCFLDWRATDPVGACYSFLYGGVMLVLIAATVLCNLAVCRSLVGMNQRTGIVRTELCEQGGSRRRFPRLPSVTSAAEIQMFWLLVFMTIVFLVCSIPLVVRTTVDVLPVRVVFVDLLAIRFASFNPILDPWVYILCRKNLFLQDAEARRRCAPCTSGEQTLLRAPSAHRAPVSQPNVFDECFYVPTYLTFFMFLGSSYFILTENRREQDYSSQITTVSKITENLNPPKLWQFT